MPVGLFLINILLGTIRTLCLGRFSTRLFLTFILMIPLALQSTTYPIAMFTLIGLSVFKLVLIFVSNGIKVHVTMITLVSRAVLTALLF